MTTYAIPASNYGWLTAKIEKLNKTAAKLGVAPVVVTVVEERVVQLDERTARKTYVVEVTGEAPVLAGWRFVGTIQHVHDNGESVTILRAVPGENLSEYRDATPEWCDHCETRRQRNDTFVVEKVKPDVSNPDYLPDVRKRVGRQCLRDFLGHPKPEMYADWAESLALIDSLFRGASEEQGSASDRVYLTEPFMRVTAAVIAQYGWVSGRAARENPELNPTRSVVLGVYMGDMKVEALEPTGKDENGRYVYGKAAEAFKLADAALEWARTALPDLAAAKPENDYLYNLAQVARLEAIDHRMFGIAVSLIPAYQRELRRNASYEERAARSHHFGEPGVRSKFVLTVVNVRGTNQGYNVVEFEDEAGNEAVWFTNQTDGITIGKTYTVAATVKRHGEFRGVRQTVLGRAKIVGGT